MEPLQAPEGDVVATHTATMFGRVLAVLVLLVPGAGLCALASQAGQGQAALIGSGLVLVTLGVLAFVQQNRSKVVARADGIERWGLRGKLWALRWADMIELRYRAVKMRVYGVIPAGTTIHVTLTDPAGKKRVISSGLKNIDVLAERVADQQTSARLPEARAQIDRGEEVRFGKALILDRERIQARKLLGGYKSCPIGEIEKVSVDAGFLKIRQKGKMLAFASARVGAIPNVFLLLRLLDTMVGRASAIPQDRDFSARAHVG